MIWIFLISVFCPSVGHAQTDYSVLDFWDYYSDAENSLYKQQCAISFASLSERETEIAKLQTKENWLQRQKVVKEKLNEMAGPFPEKTPLNAVITKKIKRDGYSVENLYFESMPGVRVTASFFIPEGKKRNLPTIIYCSGHSAIGYRGNYQQDIINMAKKGFAVLAFDPFGQGERLQYFDEKQGKSQFGATREHSFPGAQLFINGASAARYMIWDGIRAVDYVLTRKEVDKDRIGITGRSGGGTQTVYIAAFDERIKASAPQCYLTSLEYQLKTRGPQDAEQNFINWISLGLDQADFLEVMVPRANLMITTTRDIFSIQGARDTYLEVQKAYHAFDQDDDILMVEDNGGHETTLKNREEMYAFFQKHLENPGSSKYEEVEMLAPEELYATETGQLSTSIQSKFLFDISADLAKTNMDILHGKRGDLKRHLTEVKAKALGISGIDLGNVTNGKLVFSGQTESEDYFLNKYLIEQPNDQVIPFVVFLPKQANNQVVLYLDDLVDKKSDETYAIPIQLAKKGMTVIAPDLPGYGALGPGYLKGDAYFGSTSYNQWFAGILNGKSMVAIHAEDIAALLHFCKDELKLADKNLIGVSKGGFNSSLLHAAMAGVHFEDMVLLDPIMSFESIVSNKEYKSEFIPFTVAGALPYYDLPDLSATFAPANLVIYHAKDANGNEAGPDEMSSYDFVKKHYKSMNMENNFTVISSGSHENWMDLLSK